LPNDGLLIDLGFGPGTLLMYMAKHRPDVRIIGFDLSSSVVELGRQSLIDGDVSGRVDLRVGDMKPLLMGNT
jgi:cyclopropane fatty-acyl-phospholipid synthase-like methyltransferase